MNEIANSSGPPGDREQSILSHLAELRSRILASVACVMLVFLALLPLSNSLYTFLALPLMQELGASTMIATQVASPVLAPFKLAFFVAIFISVPYLFYQVWAFVAPGLYLHERRLVWPLLVSSTVLFYAGMAFAYYLVFPVIFYFFTVTAPQGVTYMPDISSYLNFVLMMFFSFGVAFEIPIATVLLIKTGIVERKDLADKRRYVFLAAFVVGAVLTPSPDVLSQILLAGPIYLLFETGLLASRYI